MIRIVGQVLLWCGFLTAALAAVCQKEVDLLPESELSALAKLPETMEISQEQLHQVSSKNVAEMTSEEFSQTVDAMLPIIQQNADEAEEHIGLEDVGLEDTNNEEEEEEAVPMLAKNHFVKGRVSSLQDKWPTIPWLWYGLAMGVGVVGVVLLRSTSKSAAQEEGRVAEEYSVISSSLDQLSANLSKLGKDVKTMQPADVVHYIDDHCAELFAQFADARNSLIQRFGLQAYAEIMTQFASAERFVNRSWSAAADGYMGEVEDCLARAEAHLKKAGRLVNQFEDLTDSQSKSES